MLRGIDAIMKRCAGPGLHARSDRSTVKGVGTLCVRIHPPWPRKDGENHTFEHSTFFVRTNINACGCKIGSFMSRNAIQHGRAAANDTVDGVLVAGIPLQQNSR